jgi:hypothetical protein
MKGERNILYPYLRTRSTDNRMSGYEWERAEESMRQALYLGDLTLAGVRRVRSAFAPLAQAMRRRLALMGSPVAHRGHN